MNGVVFFVLLLVTGQWMRLVPMSWDVFPNSLSVAIQYLSAWLQGSGAVAIFNLMEDAATAEISRSQLWQWVKRGAPLAGNGKMSAELYKKIRDEELEKLGGAGKERYGDAAAILDGLVLSPTIDEFLTLKTYAMLS